jgi:hypothetical protein
MGGCEVWEEPKRVVIPGKSRHHLGDETQPPKGRPVGKARLHRAGGTGMIVARWARRNHGVVGAVCVVGGHA